MNDQDTIAVQKEITELITNMGGSFTGFSYVRDLLPEYLKPYPYAITFGIKLSDAIIDEIDLEKPTHNYFNHYRSVNFLIDQINLQILLTLQSEDTTPTPSRLPKATGFRNTLQRYLPPQDGAVASDWDGSEKTVCLFIGFRSPRAFRHRFDGYEASNGKPDEEAFADLHKVRGRMPCKSLERDLVGIRNGKRKAFGSPSLLRLHEQTLQAYRPRVCLRYLHQGLSL